MRLIGEGRVYFVAERGSELLAHGPLLDERDLFLRGEFAHGPRAQGPTESPLAWRSMGVTRTSVAPRRRVSVL
jgi:hypothetical protein